MHLERRLTIVGMYRMSAIGMGCDSRPEQLHFLSTDIACWTQLPGQHLTACDFGIPTQMRTANQQSDLSPFSSFKEVKVVVGLNLVTIFWRCMPMKYLIERGTGKRDLCADPIR